MVREPRDDEVVERHLAQRGLRHVHGDEGDRGVPARLEPLGRVRPVAHRGLRHRRPRHAPGRSSSRSSRPTRPRACSTSSPTRRAAPSCACSSSTSARTASATASATTSPTHAYGNTETTDLWDAIEEVVGRAGAPHHGQLDLPGRPPRSSRSSSPARRRRAAAPGAVPPVGRRSTPTAATRPRASATCGRCRSCCARRSAATASERAGAARGARRPTSTLGGDVDWVVGQRRRRGLLPGPLPADAARARSSHHGIGRLDVLERYGILDDATAPTRRRVDAGARSCSSSPGPTPTRPTSPCGSAARPSSSTSTGTSSTSGDRAAFQATCGPLAGAGPPPPRLRTPHDGDDDRTRELRGDAAASSPPSSATTPRPIAEARALRGPPSSPTPRLGRPAAARRRRDGRRRRDRRRRGLRDRRSTATGRRRRRRRRCASSTPSPASTTPTLIDRLLRPVPHRGPHAERAVPAARRARRTAPRATRAWSFVRQQLGRRSTSASRRTPSCGCSRASPRSPTTPSPPTCRRSSPSTRCPRAPSSSAQHLERQQAGVALRARTKGSLAGR